MSPEQASGDLVTEPSDWYAVGVMLYQVLTGRLPFEGPSFEVLRRKQHERAIPPAELVAGVSADLNALCVKLLERDPRERASYSDIARVMSMTASVDLKELPSAICIGRNDCLNRLASAYVTAENYPVLVHLSGPSGIGKSLLLREFTRPRGTPKTCRHTWTPENRPAGIAESGH